MPIPVTIAMREIEKRLRRDDLSDDELNSIDREIVAIREAFVTFFCHKYAHQPEKLSEALKLVPDPKRALQERREWEQEILNDRTLAKMNFRAGPPRIATA